MTDQFFLNIYIVCGAIFVLMAYISYKNWGKTEDVTEPLEKRKVLVVLLMFNYAFFVDFLIIAIAWVILSYRLFSPQVWAYFFTWGFFLVLFIRTEVFLKKPKGRKKKNKLFVSRSCFLIIFISQVILSIFYSLY